MKFEFRTLRNMKNNRKKSSIVLSWIGLHVFPSDWTTNGRRKNVQVIADRSHKHKFKIIILKKKIIILFVILEKLLEKSFSEQKYKYMK